MEFVEGGEVLKYILDQGHLHEEEARRIFKQVPSSWVLRVEGFFLVGSQCDM